MPTPVQPLEFPHNVHVGKKIACTSTCHEGVTMGPVAGLPSVRTCMICHDAIATDRPRIQQITAMREKGIDLAWQRVFGYPADRMSSSITRLTSAPTSSARPATAASPSRRSPSATSSMTMGFCVNCHNEKKASSRLPDVSLLMDHGSPLLHQAHGDFRARVPRSRAAAIPRTSSFASCPTRTSCLASPCGSRASARCARPAAALTVRVMDADADVVRNGQAGVVRIVAAKKLEGSPTHPVNHGGLCARGQAAIQVTYHPDRITQPLKRAGERGDGRYEAISWDAALAGVVARLDALEEAPAGRGQSAFITRVRSASRLARRRPSRCADRAVSRGSSARRRRSPTSCSATMCCGAPTRSASVASSCRPSTFRTRAT